MPKQRKSSQRNSNDNYTAMPVEALRLLLSQRRLVQTGPRRDLIARLRTNDSETPPTPVPVDSNATTSVSDQRLATLIASIVDGKLAALNSANSGPNAANINNTTQIAQQDSELPGDQSPAPVLAEQSVVPTPTPPQSSSNGGQHGGQNNLNVVHDIAHDLNLSLPEDVASLHSNFRLPSLASHLSNSTIAAITNDTRLQSRVTVAAQQRAEAAYRRQRMAQERAEQTAVWRAEMEVERARMLKEMSGGGSRRPSYCQELEDLPEEAPEVREHLDDCLQYYTVKTKNHRNSLPVNGYPRSTVITERRGSRDERERQTYRQQKTRGNDENGNGKRRLSTGEKIDLDFLRIIANRSTQTSPSNVRIEEHEQDGDESKNVNQTLELDVGVAEALKGSEETRSEESKKSEDKSITENIDVSQDHMSDKPVNSYNDATSSDNEDVSTTHEHSMTVDDNGNETVHDSKRSSNIKIENSSEGLEGTQQIKDANSFNHDGDKNTAEVSGDLNEERSKNEDTKETVGEEPNEQVQKEIAEKQEHDKQQNGLLEYKEMEQKRDEDKEHGEEQIPNK